VSGIVRAGAMLVYPAFADRAEILFIVAAARFQKYPPNDGEGSDGASNENDN
jgi:hypothetical protein